MYNAPCTSMLWFLPVLTLSVYLWGFFWPTYIRRSNVSVSAESRHYNNPLLSPSWWHFFWKHIPKFIFGLLSLVNKPNNIKYSLIMEINEKWDFPTLIHSFFPLPQWALWFFSPSFLQRRYTIVPPFAFWTPFSLEGIYAPVLSLWQLILLHQNNGT